MSETHTLNPGLFGTSARNGFELHGFKHLSASTLNLFARAPWMLTVQKLLGHNTPVGCAAHRGTAAEAGIAFGLLHPHAEIEACQAEAVKTFDMKAALSGDPRKDNERKAVPSIVAAALPELRQYGIPTATQVRIEKWLPGIPLPLIGYEDIRWDQHGISLDIKSTLRVSSEISDDHARQVAGYVHGTNLEGRIAYCGPKHIAVYKLENVEQRIAEVVNIATRLERFLALSPDPNVLASFQCPDTSSFYVSDPTTRALVQKVFGM